MILTENMKGSNLDAILKATSNFGVITDQQADSLHDLVRVAELNGYPDIAKQINAAESLVRQASMKLSLITEDDKEEE